jgi:ATP/ADP translocase
MVQASLRLLNLRENEWRLALALLAVLAINSIVLELADVVATAGFVSSLGAEKVPWLWIADMIVALVVAGFFSGAIDRAPKLQVLSWLIGTFAAVYLVTLIMFSAGLPDWITYPLLYIVSDQQFMILPLAFWALVNDIYTMSEAKRLIPVIAVGTALGSVIGNSLPALSALYIAPEDEGRLIVLAVLLLLGSLGLLQITFRARVIRARSAKPDSTGLVANLRVGADFFANLPLFRYLAVSMLLVGLALTIIEFNLLSMLEKSFATSLAFQAFYGLYKAALIACLVVFQGLITGRLLQRVAMRNGYLALPSALLAAGGLALMAPGLAGAAGGRFLARFVERAWDEPLRKATLALVPDERRGRISVFLDSYFFTAATIAGSVLLLLLIRLDLSSVFSARMAALVIATLAAAGAVWAAVRARSAYDASLLNWRLARSRRKSVLDGIDF